MVFFETGRYDSECWACGHKQGEHNERWRGPEGQMHRCSHMDGLKRCLCMNFRWTRPVY